MTEILEMTVTFSLPDWVGDYDYYKRVYDEKDCYSHETLENEVADHLWKEMDWDEASMHPMGRWVKFKLDVGEGDVINVGQVVQLNHQLCEILEGHFESGRRKPHGNVY